MKVLTSLLYVSFGLTMMYMWALTHLTYNVTASEPIGLYRITARPIAKGELVLLRNPLKRLVGSPGDTVTQTPDGIAINGQPVPNSAIPKGSPYPAYAFGTFRLGPDQYWVMGENPASWDCRYLGPLPGDLLASVVEPVLTK